jgi:hypothetical protein
MTSQEQDRTAVEAARVLDTLAALSVELACHCDVPPERLVLQAAKVRETCATLDEAVAALKRILSLAELREGPLVDPGVRPEA